ncbi:MAG: hypothetical protein KF780_13645 [Sphingomonas sp.]|nr:hypothetical protein [Sphingomonas sp.]
MPDSSEAFSYADLADLALAAPIAAHVRVDRARALAARDAPNVPSGYRRFLIEGRVAALIRGPAELAQQVRFLADLPDQNGRAARIRRNTEYLLLAAPVSGRPGELRLIAPDSLIAFDPAAAARLRAILRESLAPDAPPRITGIGRAFNVPGSLPGESETQIFLQTGDGRPISLSVLRRPGERPHWSVALSEIVDEAAAPPEPDTLLWYRLACTLPAQLPAQSLQEANDPERRAIGADYRLVKERLGPCVRNRRPR